MSALAGKRVLVTRPLHQSKPLVEMLEQAEAIPVLFPAIEIQPAEDHADLDKALQELNSYTWVIFTSSNGVSALYEHLQQLRMNNDAFHGVKIAAIGPKTAQALHKHGFQVDFVPGEYRAEAILAGLGELRGKRMLLLRTDLARKTLRDEILRSGASADEIAIYQVKPARPDSETFTEMEKGFDIATFTSSSTVRNFLEITGNKGRELMNRAVVACIGPITAETARQEGLEVQVVAKAYTIEGLVEALEAYLEREPRIENNDHGLVNSEK
jgi:uroporphyrinogen-III synthase